MLGKSIPMPLMLFLIINKKSILLGASISKGLPGLLVQNAKIAFKGIELNPQNEIL